MKVKKIFFLARCLVILFCISSFISIIKKSKSDKKLFSKIIVFEYG
jgi:hypothetical protein